MITAVVNCKIYFIVKHHRNQIQVQQVQVAQNVQNTESVARQRKSAVSTFYIFLVFLVCNLPEYCFLVAHLISPSSTALTGVLLYSLTLMFLNSSLRASSYELGNRAGSATGMNFVVCSYGKFQPGPPG